MKIRHIAAAMAAALVVAVPAAAFAAGPPYKVSVGGSAVYSPSHPITATSVGSLPHTIRNASSTIVNVPCTSAQLTGTVTSGTGINPVMVFPSSIWSGCTIPGGAALMTQGSTWNFVGTGSNATASMTDVVAGCVSNVKFTRTTVANPNVCSFTVEGHMAASFNEATQRLTVNEVGYTGNLTVTSVSGCLGLIQVGNPFNLVMTTNVASPDGVIDLA